MLDAAIRLSLQRPDVASSSSNKLISASPDAVRRARAAEARLAAAKRGVDDAVDDSQMLVDDGDDSDSPLSDLSEDDVPLAQASGSRKKAAAGKKKKVTVRSTPKKPMTMRDLRESRRKARAAARLARKPNQLEEDALRKELGRKLTYAEKSNIALRKNHPELKDVWGDLAANIPIIVPTQADQPANLKLTLLPFQRESLFWMKKQEAGIWNGGMLATIQIIALFVSDAVKPNLVVAPTVAIMQWRNEIAAHTDGLRVLIWHGAGRESNPGELEKYDVVLTTYAVMESCFRKQEQGFKRKGHLVKEKSPLHRVHWKRIVLDEAHNIKERSTNTAKAAFELQADARWCLSGTPLQNRVGELYSLVRFLGGDPFSYYFCKKCDCKSLHWRFSDKRSCDDCGHNPMQHTCFWNNEILTPIQKHGITGPGQVAFKKLKILLDRMMLRRTKLQRADDLDLPPRTVLVRRDYFSEEEKELYLSLFSDAKRQFNTYLSEGTILNNYSNIFSLLTRMRQMACHPDLVLRSKTNATKFIAEEQDEVTDAIQSKCHHIFDRECIKQYLNTAIEQNPQCPLEQNLPNARQGILGRLNLDKWRSSTKIEALVEELSNLRMQDATTKSLVFSQFVNFLDLIAYRLQRAGFKVCRLEGTMSPQARDATIKHFTENVEVTVFLISLKAGGVALNLTAAHRVHTLDPWWNPAVEYQAIDRIHRLGQHRPVKAIKLISRILQLQQKKSAMIDATLSSDDSAMGRLTPDDLGFLFRVSSSSPSSKTFPRLTSYRPSTFALFLKKERFFPSDPRLEDEEGEEWRAGVEWPPSPGSCAAPPLRNEAAFMVFMMPLQ
ncbi:P-loop containing nucleoside triphosphate hydrolase protein [Mycena filopes]|nr:P-loop containing nucleoside triphosphate hydrolase protein [Mycena filopes]